MIWLTEPPQSPEQPVVASFVIAKNVQQVEETTQTKRIVGVCEVINRVSRAKDEVKIELDSKFHAGLYMANYEGRDLRFENPQITIIQPPTHGRLLDGFYYPEKGYFGKDFSVIRVKENGMAVDIYYFLRVLENVENEPYNNNCPVRSEGVWKISTTPEQTDPAITDLDSYIAALNQGAYFTGQPIGFGSYAIPTYTFTSLPGTSVGQTIGEGSNASVMRCNALRGLHPTRAAILGLRLDNPTQILFMSSGFRWNNDIR